MACLGSSAPADAGAGLSDAEKRAKINSLYAEYRKAFEAVPDMTAEELVAKRIEGDFVLVDVRTPAEMAVSMLPGALSREAFEANKTAYKDRPVVTYCTIGARSGAYARTLLAEGYAVSNLAGSVLAWTFTGESLVDSHGDSTRKVHVYGAKWDLLASGYEAVR